MRILITVEAGSRRALLSLEVDPRTPVTELAGRLSAEIGVPRSTVMRIDGREVALDGAVSGSGLRDGAAVVFGDMAERTSGPDGIVDLCVVGGTGSGGVARLGIGQTTVQVTADGRLRVDAPLEPAPAIQLQVAIDGSVRVRSTPGRRAAAEPVLLDGLDGALDDFERVWQPGSQVRIGSSALAVLPTSHADADMLPSAEPGRVDYNRPPRLLPPMPKTSYRLPANPHTSPRNPLPWLGAAVPTALGTVAAVLVQVPAFLLLALGTPLILVGNWLVSRRHGVPSHRVRLQEHMAERADLEAEVREAVRREQQSRRTSNPGAAELRLIATTPTRRLWERRSTDLDHLEVRIGLADAPSRVELEDLAEPEHRRTSRAVMSTVPVTVPLREAGVVGIAGHGDWPRRRARWMLGQLGVLQSPRDVQMYVLAASESAVDWAWTAWLPHMRPTLGQNAVALLGTTAETLAARVSELSLLIAERRVAAADVSRRQNVFIPSVVVVLDGARRLRALPGVVGILRDGPAVGVIVICLDGDEQQLPEECTAVVLARAEGGMLLRRQNADDIDILLVDEVAEEWFDEVARSVAPVRDVTAHESEGVIPDSARLVEVLGIEEIDPEQASARWDASTGTTEAVVGVSIDGPFALDLVRDGPHVLVAGTTGSGKSEFLQTIVASLALANTPETMTFVLIDYKGGAAFSRCALLPHTVGMVTDLDSHLVGRALDSLRAELIHREHLLAAAGAKDLEDYLDAQRRGHARQILPRLTIVIDEFAAMANELPEFVSGLVNIAQRGRSLGIHLILATQRPSGVISAEIRANTNLRIGLRMTDKSESSDVIDSPDAAQIGKHQPGRAFARLGHSSLLPFQTARVGGRRMSRRQIEQVEPPFLTRLSPPELGFAPPRLTDMSSDVSGDTDLSAIVSALRDAATRSGFTPPRRPWLPPLPERLGLDEVAMSPVAGSVPSSHGRTSRAMSTVFAWGQEDEPAAQRQAPAVIDLDAFGHMYVVGAPGSGRSTMLRTTAMAAASVLDARDLHIYGLDCGNGALAVLDELPHTGAVVQRTQTDRVVRLIARLKGELALRQQVLARGSHANVVEQREHAPDGSVLAHVLVLVDRWESFVGTLGEADGGALVDAMHELLRDGATVGIHLIITGDRSLLSSRMSGLTDDVLVLRLNDRLDFGLAGIDHRALPDRIPPGRGFRARSGREVQVAILGDDPSGRGQTETARAMSAAIVTRSPRTPGGPFRVDDLPPTIDLEGAYAYAGAEAGRPLWAMLGVGGDQVTAMGIDLVADAPTFIIGGPSRSGRSTLLLVMAESLLRTGTQLVVAAPRASPLRHLDGREGVRAVLTGTELDEGDLAPLLDPDGDPVAFLVDDAELLTDVPAKTWLRAFIRTASDNRRALVLAGEVTQVAAGFSGWQIDAKKNRRGALLSPQSQLDGDLIGTRLPRSSVSSQVVPGRALVHLGTGELLTVMVPTVPLAATQHGR